MQDRMYVTTTLLQPEPAWLPHMSSQNKMCEDHSLTELRTDKIISKKKYPLFPRSFRKVKKCKIAGSTWRHIARNSSRANQLSNFNGAKWFVSFPSKLKCGWLVMQKTQLCSFIMERSTVNTVQPAYQSKRYELIITNEFQYEILSVHFWRKPSNKNYIYIGSPHYVWVDVFADLHSERNLCYKHYTYMASHLCG